MSIGIFAALIVFVAWVLWYIRPMNLLKQRSKLTITIRTSYHTMPKMRRILFGSTIVMFILSAIHLGLVIQELTVDKIPLACAPVQIILSMFQVC